MEDAVNTISQVDEVRSTSSEGQSLVTIQFELSKNGDVAAQEVQNKVNLIVPQPAADRQAAGGAEVRSRRRAHPADRRLAPSARCATSR